MNETVRPVHLESVSQRFQFAMWACGRKVSDGGQYSVGRSLRH